MAAVIALASLERRLVEARDRIAAAGADPDAVTVVAVTKGFGTEVVAAAIRGGLFDLGENYAQDLVAKAAAVGQSGQGAPRWHFLGRPQTNKIRRLVPYVTLWQGIDSVAAAEALAARAPGAAMLVQVNVQGDAGKPGCAPGDTAGIVERARALGLDVRGLMCVGPAGDPTGSRRAFATVAGLARDVGVSELSMGMTDDFHLAVAEGSTMVRLGRFLFGPRPGSG